jgi:DNA-binding GntR family transcriptional regulator
MTRRSAIAASDQDIYNRIFEAVLDRRLRPGAHLREVELARMFGVSRTKVRQALAKLIQVGIVEMRPNRGAAVAAPTRRQAQEVFELRRMLEPAIAGTLAERQSPQQVARLKKHVDKERQARSAHDEAALIRMTGEFHLILAGMLGNAQVDSLLHELEAMTCLSMLSYARPGASACPPDEHEMILDAIAAGDSDRARSFMATHLDHVHDDLDLEERPQLVQSLSTFLGFNELPKVTAKRQASGKS